jgi:hypothetical protein
MTLCQSRGTDETLAHLFSVACASPGNCAGAGFYERKQITGAAMIATETDGVWSRAREVTLPADSTKAAPAQVAWLLGVAPSGRSSYVAVGSYITTSDAAVPMVVSVGSAPPSAPKP